MSDEFVLIQSVGLFSPADFYIAKYPVVQHDQHVLPSERTALYRATWLEAIRYCNALSRQYQLPPAYCPHTGCLLDAAGQETTDFAAIRGFRLPSEKEWVAAAEYNKGNLIHHYSIVQKKHYRIPYLDYPISAHEIECFEHGYRYLDELLENPAGIYGLLGYAKEWSGTTDAICHWEEYITNYDNHISYQVRSMPVNDGERYPFRVVIRQLNTKTAD